MFTTPPVQVTRVEDKNMDQDKNMEWSVCQRLAKEYGMLTSSTNILDKVFFLIMHVQV